MSANIMQFLHDLRDPDGYGHAVSREVMDKARALAAEADVAIVYRLDPHHAQARLKLANLAGAVAALAKEINAAGGYHVFDPGRQAPIQRAMIALSSAYDEALALPPITHQED